MSIQRYDGLDCEIRLFQKASGTYVLHADHQREIAVKEAEIELLKKLHSQALDRWNSANAKRDALMDENASLKAQVERLSASSEQPAEELYVAWLRWSGVGTYRHLVVCDSDSEGAFKVWRH